MGIVVRPLNYFYFRFILELVHGVVRGIKTETKHIFHLLTVFIFPVTGGRHVASRTS